MDPVSLSGLAVTAATVLNKIVTFVRDVRAARKDLDAVSRELTSIQLCLEVLDIDNKKHCILYPEPVTDQLNQILVNLEYSIEQIRELLLKLQVGRLGRRIQWSLTAKQEMNKLKSSLESNKTALEIALSLGTISMLARQSTESKAKAKATTDHLKQIDDKVDILIDMQRDNSRFDVLRAEIAQLKFHMSFLAALSAKSSPVLSSFVQQAKSYAKTALQPFSDTNAQLSDLVDDISETIAPTSMLDSKSADVEDDGQEVCSTAPTLNDTSSVNDGKSMSMTDNNLADSPNMSSTTQLTSCRTSICDTLLSSHRTSSDIQVMHIPVAHDSSSRRDSAPAKMSQTTALSRAYNLHPTISAPSGQSPCTPSCNNTQYPKAVPVIEFEVIFVLNKIQLRLKSFVLDALRYEHAPKKARKMSDDKVKDLMVGMLRLQKYHATSTAFQSIESPSSIIAKLSRFVIDDVLRVLDWRNVFNSLPSYRLFLQVKDKPLADSPAAPEPWFGITTSDRVWLMIWNSGRHRSNSLDAKLPSLCECNRNNTSFADPASQQLRSISFSDPIIMQRLSKTPGFMT